MSAFVDDVLYVATKDPGRIHVIKEGKIVKIITQYCDRPAAMAILNGKLYVVT